MSQALAECPHTHPRMHPIWEILCEACRSSGADDKKGGNGDENVRRKQLNSIGGVVGGVLRKYVVYSAVASEKVPRISHIFETFAERNGIGDGKIVHVTKLY